MFHRYGQRGKPLEKKALKDLNRMVPAGLLLSEERRTVLINQIKTLTALDESRFESQVQLLINNLIAHCQSLPETSNSYYSQPGGVLDYALNRTEAALGIFQQFVINEAAPELSEEQKLWQYALLSAALMRGLGKLYIDYKVELYDDQARLIKEWNPLLESMSASGSHYRFEFDNEGADDFRKRLNLLIARFLMPAAGFAWLAENPEVLAVWLALLNEDYEGAGTLGAILIRADAIAIQRSFIQMGMGGFSNRSGRFGRVGSFSGGQPESIVEIEQRLGLEFLQWVTKSLESGLIMINKPPLFMVPGGMLMTADLFKLFIRDNPEFKNWQAVQNAFLALGLHSPNADGGLESRFEQQSNQQIHTGILVSKYAVALPEQFQALTLANGKVQTTSATELIHQANHGGGFTQQQRLQTESAMFLLSRTGEWQARVTEQPSASVSRPGTGK